MRNNEWIWPQLFSTSRERKVEKNITLMTLNYSYAWSCIACHGLKYQKESKRLDPNIHFTFFFKLFDEGTLNNYQYT